MDAHVTFIESFYEKLFPVKQDNKKCFIWPTVLLLVLLLIVLWLSQGTDWLSESGLLYLNAAPVLCTVVFWPFIIIDISYRFHDTYKAINELVKEKKNAKHCPNGIKIMQRLLSPFAARTTERNPGII